ncbi:MAG: class I SAM-dependent methyltransferase [Isosphaeraceae bacterium]
MIPGNTRRRRRPESVDDALWAYATSDRLATEENQTFAEHPLIKADTAWIASVLGPGSGLLADFGCGAGRAANHMQSLGWHCIAIDLSQPMLLEAAKTASKFTANSQAGTILPVRGNLTRPGFLPPDSLDSGLCLFSTLGMMRHAKARRLCLAGMAAALKPGGRLLLHAHNWWVHRWHAQGRRWMLADLPRRWLGRAEFGNRQANYRGIPGVVIHNFTWPEISSEITRAGLEIKSVNCLHGETAESIGSGFLDRHFRAGGWLIEAVKNA